MNEVFTSYSEPMEKGLRRIFVPDNHYPFSLHMCGTSYCEPNYKIARGITSYYTIEYIISGKGYVEENETVCHPKAGDTHIFHSGSTQLFYTDPDDPWVKVWVIFAGPFADSLFEVYGLNDCLHFPGLNLRKPLEEIIDICSCDLPLPEIFAKCSVIVTDMVQKLYLYRLYTNYRPEATSTAEKLKTIIDTMSNFNVSLDDLVKYLYCSRNHAIKLFTQQFHISPYKYMSQIRLKNAQHLLQHSSLPISDIAITLGFCDSRYFANWFKKQKECTPTEYRHTHQK